MKKATTFGFLALCALCLTAMLALCGCCRTTYTRRIKRSIVLRGQSSGVGVQRADESTGNDAQVYIENEWVYEGPVCPNDWPQ